MAYARLPDTFPFAMETVAVGNAAIGALCRCMAWSAGSRTDGFVPESVAEIIGSKKERDILAMHGLLVPVAFGEVRIGTGRISRKADVTVVMPGDGYWMPEYHVYNVSALEDAAASEKGRKGGLASREARTPASESTQPARPQVEPRVQPAVEAHAQPTVELTGQDKTRHQKTRAAVTETKKEPGSPEKDSEAARAALPRSRPAQEQNAARASETCVKCGNGFAFGETGSTVLACPACATAERGDELAAAVSPAVSLDEYGEGVPL